MAPTRVLICLSIAQLALGQDSTDLSFEVASVKPVERMFGPRKRVEDGERIEYRHEYVFNLLLRAYGVQAFQVSGPSWLKDNQYDITATLPKGTTKADIPQMLRRLLLERFQLSLHREMRMTPVYLISIAKGGPKLQPCQMKMETKPQTLEDRIGGLHVVEPGECFVNRVMTRGESTMVVEANTLAFLAQALKDGTDRPVFDRTGLDGHFQIAFVCAQANVSEADTAGVPTMVGALKKLGLNLEASREPVEFLVVDKGNKVPAEN